MHQSPDAHTALGLEQALELYVSLLLHVQCAQYPGEAGAGKAPDGMCHVIDMVARCAPAASGAHSAGAGDLWRRTASAVLLVCADACALNRCNEALARGVCWLVQKVMSHACLSPAKSLLAVAQPSRPRLAWLRPAFFCSHPGHLGRAPLDPLLRSKLPPIAKMP